MIQKLKTLAIAMLATGATVTAVNGKTPPPVTTNILQSVTVALTYYGNNGINAASFKTSDLLTAIENSITGVTFGKHATLSVATVLAETNIESSPTSNSTPILVTNIVSPAVAVSSNTVVIGTNGMGTNLTIGVTDGNYLSISSNGTVSIYQAGPDGPTLVTNEAVTGSITLGTSNVVVDGTTLAISNTATFGGTPEVDTTDVVITSGGGTTNIPGVGAVIYTNEVISTVGGVSTTNSFDTNDLVYIGSELVVSNGAPVTGFGTNSSLPVNFTSTTFTVSAANGGTNVSIVTTATEYSTNTAVTTNGYEVVTPGYTSWVVADQGTNTSIPTNILVVREASANNIATTVHGLDVDYSVKHLELNATNLTFKLQGLVKSSEVLEIVGTGSGKTTLDVTNANWTDVNGYGTNGLLKTPFPVVYGGAGTITIGTPTKQPIR